MRRFGNLILGAILGGFVGGGIGLLLAPKSGKALRGDISDYTDHVKTEVRRATDQRRVELEHELDAMREPVKGSD
jgi:gas vesicle protein